MTEVPVLAQQVDKLDSKIQRLQKLEAKLSASIKQAERQIESKASQPRGIDLQRSKKQLQSQLENAKSSLKNYQVELRHYQKLSNRTGKAGLEELASIEEQNREKEKVIQRLTQEVKELELRRKKQEKSILEREKQKQMQVEVNRVGKATEEARTLQGLLSKAEESLGKKKELLELRQGQLREIQSKFEEECRRQGIDPEQFKLRKKKDTSEEKLRDKRDKPSLSIRDGMTRPKEEDLSEATLLRKKEVLERSSQQARKKFKQELDALSSRLKALKEERAQLQLRIQQKEEERRAIARKRQKEE